MSNVTGHLFRVVTFGESHGPAVGAVIDGCPAGVALDEALIAAELARSRPIEALATARHEPNLPQILSGVADGYTLGTPIAVVVPNAEARPDRYSERTGIPRPGHAELTWQARFGRQDWRGGGRASGRECVARLAAGAVARQILGPCGLRVASRVTELAGLPVACDDDLARAIERATAVAAGGDTSGGRFEVVVSGAPAGLGAPVFAKLKAELPAALLSIGAVTYAAVGDGLDAPGATGAAWNDPLVPAPGGAATASNRCGGLLGGMSTGGEIRLVAGVKPSPTVHLPQASVNLATGQACELVGKGRFDTNVTPRVAVIAEAMVALVLVDHLLLAGHVHTTRFELSALPSRNVAGQ